MQRESWTDGKKKEPINDEHFCIVNCNNCNPYCHIQKQSLETMKFVSAALLIASWSVSVSAFSAVAPQKTVAAGSIDRTMEGIDAADAFDPAEGENSALTRNNKGEVWVSQVRQAEEDTLCLVR